MPTTHDIGEMHLSRTAGVVAMNRVPIPISCVTNTCRLVTLHTYEGTTDFTVKQQRLQGKDDEAHLLFLTPVIFVFCLNE